MIVGAAAGGLGGGVRVDRLQLCECVEDMAERFSFRFL
jgi:hypothetical protein